jgi:hypothetical protein
MRSLAIVLTCASLATPAAALASGQCLTLGTATVTAAPSADARTLKAELTTMESEGDNFCEVKVPQTIDVALPEPALADRTTISPDRPIDVARRCTHGASPEGVSMTCGSWFMTGVLKTETCVATAKIKKVKTEGKTSLATLKIRRISKHPKGPPQSMCSRARVPKATFSVRAPAGKVRKGKKAMLSSHCQSRVAAAKGPEAKVSCTRWSMQQDEED